MTRVAAYIDGFNLYFGMKKAFGRRFFWLDVHALAQAFLQQGQTLVGCNYFTTRIRDNGRNAADRVRQTRYIDALASRGVLVHEGHYLEKLRKCKTCGATWTDYEEKKTDVNIAVRLLDDTYDDVFDVAFVVSGDSDLTTAIERVRARSPNKKVVVLFPPKRHSKQLKNVANAFLSISENKLRNSQLPDPVVTAGGHSLARPAEWR